MVLNWFTEFCHLLSSSSSIISAAWVSRTFSISASSKPGNLSPGTFWAKIKLCLILTCWLVNPCKSLTVPGQSFFLQPLRAILYIYYAGSYGAIMSCIHWHWKGPPFNLDSKYWGWCGKRGMSRKLKLFPCWTAAG